MVLKACCTILLVTLSCISAAPIPQGSDSPVPVSMERDERSLRAYYALQQYRQADRTHIQPQPESSRLMGSTRSEEQEQEQEQEQEHWHPWSPTAAYPLLRYLLGVSQTNGPYW